MSGNELYDLLVGAWDVGYTTGACKTEESNRERHNDCLTVLRDKYETLKVESVYREY